MTTAKDIINEIISQGADNRQAILDVCCAMAKRSRQWGSRTMTKRP